jgi:sugar (pentulose or hexulose) kinase
VDEAATRLVAIDRVYEPNPGLKALYDDLFAVYASAYPSLKPIYGALTHIRRGG